MGLKFSIFLITFLFFSLLLMFNFTSQVSATLEELEEPQIPPPQLEKPKIDLNKNATQGASPIQPINLYFFPNGISVDLFGNVFVSDRGHEDKAQYRMIKYTTEGKYVKQWGKYGSGKGDFNHPEGVGVDFKGNVFVADTLNDRIQKFNNNGVFINSWPIPGTPNDGWGPADVEADLSPSSGIAYVVDTNKNRILAYTNDGSKLLKGWGKFGDGPGEFWDPGGVAVDLKGNVFVGDTDNHRIQKFRLVNSCPRDTIEISPPGGVCFIKSWTVEALPNTDPHPHDIGVDSKGNVFVADSVNNHIQKYTNDGDFIKSWGGKGIANGQFRGAGDVDVDPKTGNVFVVDTNNQRIQKFNNNGEFISKWSWSGIP